MFYFSSERESEISYRFVLYSRLTTGPSLLLLSLNQFKVRNVTLFSQKRRDLMVPYTILYIILCACCLLDRGIYRVTKGTSYSATLSHCWPKNGNFVSHNICRCGPFCSLCQILWVINRWLQNYRPIGPFVRRIIDGLHFGLFHLFHLSGLSLHCAAGSGTDYGQVLPNLVHPQLLTPLLHNSPHTALKLTRSTYEQYL